MRILIVTPEANPFARSGGLAEVISALACALTRLGHQVMTVMPLYRQVRECGRPLMATGKTISIPLSFKTLTAEFYQAEMSPDLTCYFVAQDALYNREGLYGTAYGGFEDNAERFIFFSRAVVEMIEALNLAPDICHCQEWQTGLVPVYLRTLYHERPVLQKLPVLYTVHNVGYQGIFSSYDFPLTGLGWDLLSPKALEFFGKINLMKGGVVFADLINTVSHKYREEILTPEYGFGLEGVFQERAPYLFGVTSGVDYQRWDPSRDTTLAATYTPANLEGKKACKAALLRHFNLELSPEQPLLGMTTRLYERKGIDLVEAILDELLAQPVGFVLQGTGEERHQYLLQEIAGRHPGRIGLALSFNEDLAHQIIAGADIFLMPSRYEPCGLDQLYCLRYGTIPVVRATGGLDETIGAYDPETGTGQGFKFSEYSPGAFLEAIRRALEFYQKKEAWTALMKHNMTLDFSWDKVAPQYVELYERARSLRCQALEG
uniref:Glycogen synthase n=1 Tax=Desulfobacca acetoxidans TaxID=60893 RepID=A0A7V4G8M5_9BACT